jgi:hypothetical protein
MEPMLIMRTCTVILAISALGGATMAVTRFSGKPRPPTWLAMLHGFLSAAALTLLLYAVFTVGLPLLANTAVVLFLIAAAGGIFMNLNYHWKLLPLPKWLVLVHAGIAVLGFLLLLVAVFGNDVAR